MRVGSNSPNWKGGRHVTKDGYVLVKVYPDNPFYSMVNSNGYISEHRLIMAQKIGRALKSYEQPHHDDLNRQNNDPDNLILKTIGHGAGTTKKWNLVTELEEAKARIAELEGRVTILEAERVISDLEGRA